MSISSINRDLRGYCPIQRSGDDEFFTVRMKMEEKILLKEDLGWGRNYILHPAETLCQKIY
jgi:hypothetical protein